MTDSCILSSDDDFCAVEKVDDKMKKTSSAAAEEGCINNINLHALDQLHN